MITTRRTLATVLLLGLVVSSGCVGFLSGEKALTFDASKATANEQTLSDTGYEKDTVQDQTINRTVEAAGQSRNVSVTNWIARYDKQVDMGIAGEQEAAVFVALSTPQAKVLGKPFNPVGDMESRELLKKFQSKYDNIRNVREVNAQNTTMLGTETEVTKYAATMRHQSGIEIDMYIHVTKVEHEDDYVIALALYPQRMDGETQNVFKLIETLEHPKST